MTDLLVACAQMAFHIIFAVVGIGMPVLVVDRATDPRISY
jgi:cytochrome bd-type quinol oxidase subunit 1